VEPRKEEKGERGGDQVDYEHMFLLRVLAGEVERSHTEDKDVDLFETRDQGQLSRLSAGRRAQEERETCLKHVAKVDEHMMGLLHPAGDVEASGDDVAGLATLDKVGRDGEVEPTLGGFRESIGELHPLGELLDSFST
jgi:hypothetical protein